MRKVLVNAALVVVSMIVTLYAVEAVVALRSPASYEQEWRCRRLGEPDKCMAALAAGEPFDARTKLEVMRDMTEQGLEVVPSIAGPAVLDRTATDGSDPLPFGGIARTDTVYCNEGGEYVIYRSDEHGFRNPAGLYETPPVAVVLGDSFARGYCLEHDIATYLRKSVGPALNLGIDDAGPLIELAVLREIAAPLEPRVVFWLFFEGNDLKDLDNEWGREPLRRYLESEYRTGVFERQPEVDRRLRKIVSRGVAARTGTVSGASVPGPAASFVTLTRLRAWLQRASAAPRARAYPFEADRLRSVIEAARDETRSWGGELVFVYLPAWERFAEDASANPHREAILELVDDLDVPIVDAGEIFAARPDPLALFPYRLRGHYTGAGYGLIATEMGDSYPFPDE